VKYKIDIFVIRVGTLIILQNQLFFSCCCCNCCCCCYKSLSLSLKIEHDVVSFYHSCPDIWLKEVLPFYLNVFISNRLVTVLKVKHAMVNLELKIRFLSEVYSHIIMIWSIPLLKNHCFRSKASVFGSKTPYSYYSVYTYIQNLSLHNRTIILQNNCSDSNYNQIFDYEFGLQGPTL